MLLFLEEEIGEIIDITEEMCNQKGWVKEALPLAQKRMDIINIARSRPIQQQSEQEIRQDEREKVILRIHSIIADAYNLHDWENTVQQLREWQSELRSKQGERP